MSEFYAEDEEEDSQSPLTWNFLGFQLEFRKYFSLPFFLPQSISKMSGIAAAACHWKQN